MAANALIDYRIPYNPSSSKLVHLVHPRPTQWSSLASVVAEKLSVQLVPYSEWLTRLEKASRNGSEDSDDENQIDVEVMRSIPALRLLPFFRSITAKIEGSANALGFPSLACDRAVEMSSTLSAVQKGNELGEKDVQAWLKYWRKAGALRS